MITIDQKTGQGTDVNPNVRAPGEIEALAFGPDGILYGACDALFKIDTATGIPVQVGSVGYSDIRGLAPIPTPDDPWLISVVVYYFDGYYRLQRGPTPNGPRLPIDSPSPYVEALSTGSSSYFRVSK